MSTTQNALAITKRDLHRVKYLVENGCQELRPRMEELERTCERLQARCCVEDDQLREMLKGGTR